MNQEPKPEPANDNDRPPAPKNVRDFKRDRQVSRLRGSRRGNASRYALRSLPPVEEDLP